MMLTRNSNSEPLIYTSYTWGQTPGDAILAR